MGTDVFTFIWKIKRTWALDLESPEFILPYGNAQQKKKTFVLKTKEYNARGTCTLHNTNEKNNDNYKIHADETPNSILDFSLAVLRLNGNYDLIQKGKVLRNFKVKSQVVNKFSSVQNVQILTFRCIFFNGSIEFPFGECTTRTQMVSKVFGYEWDMQELPDTHQERITDIPSISVCLSPSQNTLNNKSNMYTISVKYKNTETEKFLFSSNVKPCNRNLTFTSDTARNLGNNLFSNSFTAELKEGIKKVEFVDGWLDLVYEYMIIDGKEIRVGVPELETVPPCASASSQKQSYDIPNPDLRYASKKTETTGTQTEEPKEETLENPSMNEREEKPTSPVLIEHLQMLYVDKLNSDFTLQVGKTPFSVHKGILSARSPVFCAMFNSGMREQESREVDVMDVDPATMDRLLKFVYFEHFEDVDCDRAMKLFSAADKYQIETLKSKCVYYLVSMLSADNVCDVLSLADIHQDDQLMRISKEYVSQHAKKVFQSDQWKQFRIDNLQLAADITHELFVTNLR